MGQKNLAVLTGGVFLQENVWRFLPGSQKKVVVVMRWPYYLGGHEAVFHCII